MEIEIKMSLIKYWKHIKSFPNTHILKQSYLQNLNLTTICPNMNLWSSCIKTTLESNGHGNVWHENHEINLENIHKCLLDQYRQRAHSEIFNDNIKSGTANKLRTYRMYKSELEIENYIKTRTNYNHRKAMSKLRLSDHLQIEAGWHSNIPIEARICQFCQLGIENEVHFLLKCPLNHELREKLFQKLTLTIPHFNVLNNQDKLTIMSQPRGDVAMLVTAFVHNAFYLRLLRMQWTFIRF